MKDLIISVIFAIVYCLFFYYAFEILYKDLALEIRKNKTLNYLFAIGVISILYAICVIEPTTNTKYIVRKGIKFGGILILCFIVMFHWNDLSDQLKLTMMTGSLISIVWYLYCCEKNQPIITK